MFKNISSKMPGLQFCWSFFRTKILFLSSNVSQQPRQVHQRALRALQDWSGPYAAILSDDSNMVYKLIIPHVKQFGYGSIPIHTIFRG
jgi:hypothetical protein